VTHPPIRIQNLGLSFPHKTCFAGFDAEILEGDRIAIIGRNGSGKSSLLDILRGALEPTEGRVIVPEGVVFGHVAQVLAGDDPLSGGQRLNAALTQALALSPDVLLLDEPTNHLDLRNRRALLRMLKSYKGTLLCVSHDPELLRTCVECLWHIDQGTITLFRGDYDNYLTEKRLRRASLEREVERLGREKKEAHQALMREQQRASRSKTVGMRKVATGRLPRIAVNAKRSQGEETTHRKKAVIDEKKRRVEDRLAELRLPEVIMPKFSITAEEIGDKTILSVSDGSVGYPGRETLARGITLSLGARGRLAVQGDNGSGKTTLLKAILGDPQVVRGGDWYLPPRGGMGHLDQHYATLDPAQTAAELVGGLRGDWTYAECRKHLNDFLFRKNEEVNTPVARLSGGERARLSLALIAAQTPRLLLLDEVTNNLDLETREHVLEVLKGFPGAILVVSHDVDFLERLGVEETITIGKGQYSN